MMISQCSDVTLTLIFQYFFAILCIQQSFIITKFINATKECWIPTFDLKKGVMLHFFKGSLKRNSYTVCAYI